MAWRPNTLLEFLESGNDSPLPIVRGKYQCTCGSLCIPAQIVDTRAIPGITQDWSCDGCWTKWQRTGTVIDGGNPHHSKREWLLRWVKAHNAPQEVLDKIEGNIPEGYEDLIP